MIVGIIVIVNQEPNVIKDKDATDIELQSDYDISPKIQERLDDIEKKKLENKYLPEDREWITSGPFQIDRSKYILGEKIFLRIGGLEPDEKGKVVFLRPLNSTHYTVFITIPFDGTDKPAFNYYVEPQLSKTKGYCTVDDFIGDWRVVFRGTDYPNLEFEITKQILPGSESSFQPIC